MNLTSDSAITNTPLVELSDLFIQFLMIGAVSFGGGIIAYERILLVEKRKWLTPRSIYSLSGN